MRPEAGGVGRLRIVEPDEPCDRCEHPSKYHASPEHGSECRIVEGRYYRGETISRGMRAKKCLCDRFEAAP